MANCEKCRGACCESLLIPAAPQAGADVLRWLTLHGEAIGESRIELDCKCRKLGPEGRCAIYADRPEVCRIYEPGSVDCVETVLRRRTPEQAREILGQA